MTDNEYMKIAIEISAKSQFPYGAIVVSDDIIVGRSDSSTKAVGTMYSHAELIALQDASRDALYNSLEGATIYTSCEPCVMCTGAILYSGLSRIVYACSIEDSNEHLCSEALVRCKEIIELAGAEVKVVPNVERDMALHVIIEKTKKGEYYDH